MSKNIIVFTCKEQVINEKTGIIEDTGKTVEYCVRKPSVAQQKDGQKIYNQTFRDALSSGCILRIKLEDFMREQNVWDDDKQQRLIALNRDINAGERKLRAGGFDFDEATALAKRMRGLRADLRELISDRTELDVNTAEGQADNQRFNYLISVCLVYNDTQQPVFSSLDDYTQNAGTEQAALGAEKFAQLWYNLDEDYEAKYEEIKFMREYGIINKNNHLINEDGELVDFEGRLVDENGRYITKNGDLCDRDGNLVDEEGNLLVEKKPFTRNGKVVEPRVKVEDTVSDEESEVSKPTGPDESTEPAVADE